MYKSQHNKPLILNEKEIDASKQNMCKGIKCKISTPKYMQINLKRNGLANVNENSAIDGKTRDKSTNWSKKGKLWIEFSKINSLNKARGVSADEVMKVPDGDGGQKEQKSSKPPKNKQIKVNCFLFKFINNHLNRFFL